MATRREVRRIAPASEPASSAVEATDGVSGAGVASRIVAAVSRLREEAGALGGSTGASAASATTAALAPPALAASALAPAAFALLPLTGASASSAAASFIAAALPPPALAPTAFVLLPPAGASASSASLVLVTGREPPRPIVARREAAPRFSLPLTLTGVDATSCSPSGSVSAFACDCASKRARSCACTWAGEEGWWCEEGGNEKEVVHTMRTGLSAAEVFGEKCLGSRNE